MAAAPAPAQSAASEPSEAPGAQQSAEEAEAQPSMAPVIPSAAAPPPDPFVQAVQQDIEQDRQDHPDRGHPAGAH